MKSPLYAPLRALHLGLTAAVLPMGVWAFTRFSTPAGFGGNVVLFVVASVLSLFVLALDQADYPVTTLGALRRTAPLLVNFGLGFWHGGGQLFAAAHWALTSLLASLCLSLVLAAVLALRSTDEAMRAQRGLVGTVVLPLALLAGAAAVMVAWPLVTSWSLGAPLLGAAISWLVQTAVTTRAWMKQSVFSRARHTDEAKARTAAMVPWNGPAALAQLGVMAGLLFATFFGPAQ